MLTHNDLVDLIMEYLGARIAQSPKEALPPARAGAKGRLFLSEHDIKRRLTGPSQELRIPKDAILSPLAVDWLVLKAIKVIRE